MRAFVIALFIFVVHASFVTNGFTWLDHGDIEHGRIIVPLRAIHTAFFTRFGETEFYRPIVTITQSLAYALWGDWPIGYHLASIVFHTLFAFGAAEFASKFWKLVPRDKDLIRIVVGIHPIGWVTVGAISYIQEIILASAIVWAITFYTSRRTMPFMFASLVALFSKETAVFWLPSLLFVWHRTQGIEWKMYKPLLVCMICEIVFYVGLRLHAVPEIWKISYPVMSLESAIATRLAAFGTMVVYLASPFVPPLRDTIRIFHIFDWQVLVIILCICFWFIWLAIMRKQTSVFVLSALLILFLVPAFNIVPLPRFVSTHYGYLAAICVAIGLVLLARIRRYLWVGVLIWIVVASYSTFLSGFRFKDDLALFTPEVLSEPQYREGHFYLGSHYLERNDPNQAQAHFVKAVHENISIISFVDTFSAMNNLVISYAQGEKWSEADETLQKAKGMFPSPKQQQALIYNQAVIASKQEDWEAVIALLQDQESVYPEAARLLQAAYASRGDY